MQITAVILVVLSAFIHAGWNLFSKRSNPSAAFFMMCCFSGALLLSPTLFLFTDTLIHGFPFRVWLLLASTGFFMALYYVCLAGAYRAGDMSVAYPLARSSPVIVVSTVALLLGRGDQISLACVVGIFLVVGGCFLIPLKKRSDFHWRKYFSSTCGLALFAAVGTSGYSILDDEALRLLRNSPEISLSSIQVTLLYACLECVSACIWLLCFVCVRSQGRSEMKQILLKNKRRVFFTGASIYLSYSLILVSLAFAKNISYVVGFRQLSVPLGAILGIMVLKEPYYMLKIIGVAVMFAGLIIVALG